MPNLVGYWDPGADENKIGNTLNIQLDRVTVKGVGYARYIKQADRFGAALLDHGLLENGPQPVYGRDGSVTLFMDGEIFNADELKRRYRSALNLDGVSDPQLCLELILKFGDQIVESFNGSFCLVLYDSARREAKLISDRLGIRPLYFVERDGRVAFGSEIKALCVADPGNKKIDETGLLEFFCYGSPFMGKTWLDGYTRLAPATIMTVSANGIRSKTYWDYKYDESAKPLDQKTYMSVYGTLLDRAVERNMKGTKRTGIFLSGGYDSRAVAAAIRKYHLPIPAFTFGDPESRDIKFGSQLAEALGLDHHPVTYSGPYLFDVIRSVVWRTEGMLSFMDNTSIRYHGLIKDKLDIIFSGFLGEFSGSHTWSKLLLARSRQSAIQAIFEQKLGHRLAASEPVFNPAFFERTMENLNMRFRKSFDDIANEHPHNISDCWNFKFIQPQGTFQSPSTDRYMFESRSPMTDRDLVDFALSIPPYSRLEHRIYKRVIAHQFPEIRAVPCTNNGKPINPNFATAYSGMVLEYGYRKLSSPVRSLLGIDGGLGREQSDSALEIRAEPLLAEKILRPLIDDGIFPSEIFNVGEIEKVIEGHYNKGLDYSELLSRLMSWGLASRYFLHDELSDAPRELFEPVTHAEHPIEAASAS